MVNISTNWRLRVSKLAIGFLLPCFLISTVVVAAHGLIKAKTPHKSVEYTQLMRRINAFNANKNTKSVDKDKMVADLKQFIEDEKDRLDELNVSGKKEDRYFAILNKQLVSISGETPGFFERKINGFKNLLGETTENAAPTSDLSEIKIPDNPGVFKFNDEKLIINKLGNAKIFPRPNQKIQNSLLKLVKIDTVGALQITTPISLEDLRDDAKEVLITQEIKDLAFALEKNPVKITNFIRNLISYEPYYGARKGSTGCLHERVCNDTDTSSLLIALLRASGIPARYEKSIAVFTVAQLRDLLGVAETKTAFAALGLNKVPVYTLTDRLNGVPLDDADFGPETHLALEWTHVQAFYDYDQRGGNITNVLDLSAITDANALNATLSSYPKKQWIQIDATVKPYSRTTRNILVDIANFNTENFWNSFYQYQGGLSPLDKYKQDLLSATGQNVVDNLSVKSIIAKNPAILPATTPYFAGSGELPGGVQINRENYSVLPDARRMQVKISLRRRANDEVVLSKTFFSGEINNVKLNLGYEGLTDTDKAVIASNGGIFATPAALVDIAPFFMDENNVRYEGVQGVSGRLPVQIGEDLVMKFEYVINGQSICDCVDEKFSVAGNDEGIFLSLSGIAPDALLDDTTDPNRNSNILLDGNAAIAREFIKRIREDGQTIKGSLDYEYNMPYGRTVVTQNRVLNIVDGVPTTFDFKGLSIDASSYINDYSNRGNYKNHRKDFRLLWGQQASYLEGQIFNDVSGLDGISTVKGLQYAYAHPETYTMHRITAANAGEIDQLNLTVNTKQNMHADVVSGNTILTPDKMVQDQNWRGVLYVSLRPDWTATYAIGEQVLQNGGWTIDPLVNEPVLIAANCDVMSDVGPQSCGQRYSVNKQITIWSDALKQYVLTTALIGYTDTLDNTIRCLVNLDDATKVVTNQGIPSDSPAYEKWQPAYGRVCMIAPKGFGTVSHKFIRTEFAAKFTGTNESNQELYDYWVPQNVAKQQIEFYTPGRQYNRFKFNPVAGTFSDHGSSFTAYYQPIEPTSPLGQNWQENGKGWLVTGEMLDKLQANAAGSSSYLCPTGDTNCSTWAYKYGWVLNTIGYPISAEVEAADSYPFYTEGTYQNFIGGQIYYETTWINHAYYVPGFIAKEYNDDKYFQQGHGTGTGGTLGFPVKDPVYNSQSNMLYQDFENGTRIYDYKSRPVQYRIETAENVQTIAIIRNYSDPKYLDDLKEGFMDALAEHNIVGIVVNFGAGIGLDLIIKEFKNYVVKKLMKTAAASITARLIPGVGWAFAGGMVVFAISQDLPLIQACNTDPDQTSLINGKSPAYYCGKLGVYGIASAAGLISGELANAAINRYGVATHIARLGKAKLFGKMEPSELNAFRNGLETNPVMRTNIFEDANALSDDFANQLVKDGRLLNKFASSQNASRFMKNSMDITRYDHEFRGNETGGWHYYPTKRAGSTLASEKVFGTNGVYKANAKIVLDDGQIITKIDNSFFPDSWSEEKVLEAINTAYQKILTNKAAVWVRNNEYRAADISGIEIRIYLTNDNKIISAFPFVN